MKCPDCGSINHNLLAIDLDSAGCLLPLLNHRIRVIEEMAAKTNEELDSLRKQRKILDAFIAAAKPFPSSSL